MTGDAEPKWAGGSLGCKSRIFESVTSVLCLAACTAASSVYCAPAAAIAADSQIVARGAQQDSAL